MTHEIGLYLLIIVWSVRIVIIYPSDLFTVIGRSVRCRCDCSTDDPNRVRNGQRCSGQCSIQRSQNASKTRTHARPKVCNFVHCFYTMCFLFSYNWTWAISMLLGIIKNILLWFKVSRLFNICIIIFWILKIYAIAIVDFCWTVVCFGQLQLPLTAICDLHEKSICKKCIQKCMK